MSKADLSLLDLPRVAGDDVVVLLGVCAWRLGRAVANPGGVPTGDLTLAQLSILFALLDRGPIRMTELAAHVRVRTPTASVAIRRLEKLGLVKRSPDPSDQRAVLVDITSRGIAVHRKSLANRRAALAATLSQLSEDDLETLTEALGRLVRLAGQSVEPSGRSS